MYEKIKHWYELGLWNEAMVKNALQKGVITNEQADNILNVITVSTDKNGENTTS